MNHIFSKRTKLISIQIQTNTLFQTSNERKRSICDKIIHKAMRIPFDIHQTNEMFSVTVHPKNAYKLEFTDHLCLPFIDQPQYDIVVFNKYV